MSAADKQGMYEHIGCFDPNIMAEASAPQNDNFLQTLPDPSRPPPPPPPSSLNSFEEDLRLSVEEPSYHHHNPPPLEDVSVYASSVDHPITNLQQHLVLNMGNSNNNNVNINNNMGTQLIQEFIDVFPHEQSTWDPNIGEFQDMGYQEQEPHDHQFQVQGFTSSSILNPPYPSPDFLNLLHLPGYSANSSICITNPSQNKTPNFQNSRAFLGDLPIGAADSTTTTLFDPLFHLNLPPQPPAALKELFQSLPHGYSLPTSRTSGSLFGGEDGLMEASGVVYQDAGDLSQLDNNNNGLLEFNRGSTYVVGKGREGKGTKHFATEKQRREQLNGKYKILRSLIPNPTKIDRASVVGDAIEYIKELLRTVSELKLLVEKKRYGKERCKIQRTEEDAAESSDMKPLIGDAADGSIRSSWLQRKSKNTEVDVRIIDDEVTIKLFQRKKINCLLFVSKVLDQLQLDLHHVAGGHVGEYCSFLFNSKIYEGSSVYASAIANKIIDELEGQYTAVVLPNSRL